MKSFLFLILIIPQLIFAEDIYFKVIETTPAWEDINFPKPGNISGEIPEGSIVKGHRGVQFSRLEGILENIPLQLIYYNDKRMLIYANSIIPLETQDLFDENLLYNQETSMVFSFYINALRVTNREIIYLHDKSAWEERLAFIDENDQYGAGGWWFYASGHNNLIIAQASLTFNSDAKDRSDLLIKNIKRTENGYIITVKESPDFQDRNKWWNWPKPEERELFTVLLILDGDYIDLYLENKNTLIDTFVFVDNEVITQLNNLIWGKPRGGTVDLSRVSWPRRADGSMDYPPPAGASTDPIPSQEDKQLELIDLSVDTEDPRTIQNGAKTSAMPLWAWFAVTGGAVLIASGAAVFVIKRRKS